MTYDTINDAQTIAGSGEGTLRANRYRVVRQLGQGGMGSVWLAEDTQLDNKPFAIKMLPSILMSNKRAYRQLKDEALVAMQLVHPNIVQIRAFEENNGNPFLVMDYIDGQTLDDYLAEYSNRVEHVERVEMSEAGRDARPARPLGGLPESEILRILRPIAAALDYAHSKGVVHRDVKPGNVIIAKDGTPYILDFGIAREIQETMTRVTGKLSSGTLLYMSPEQLRGQQPKSAQDVYSFAAMAYECLKGEPPFSRGQIEYQILNEQPEPLPSASAFTSVVLKGLSKSAEDRPVSCSLFFGLGRQSTPEGINTSRSGDLHVAFEKMLKRIKDADAKEKESLYLQKPIESLSGFHLGQRFVESNLKNRTVNLRGKNEEARGYRTFGLHSISEDEISHESYIYEDFSIVFVETTLVTNTICGIILKGTSVDSEYAANNVIERIKGKLERTYSGKFQNVRTPPDDELHWYLKGVKRMLRLETNDGKTVEVSMCFDSEESNIKFQYEVYVCLVDQSLEMLRQNEAVQFRQFKIAATTECEPLPDSVKHRHGESVTIILPGGASMVMIYCGPAEFAMGSPMSEWGRSDDENLHRVRLSKGYWLGKYEVTQKQWQSVMNANPSAIKGDDLPVGNVSWNDCENFVNAINASGGILARLPTEAEWEYACRAGAKESYAGEGGINNMGWYEGNSRSRIQPVGKKAANDWGFHDMHGNVWEWCSDWYEPCQDASALDPLGPEIGSRRVLRGGSSFDDAKLCRSAYRYRFAPDASNENFGLRLCCSYISQNRIVSQTVAATEKENSLCSH